MVQFKGIIALDIDGTLTTKKHFLASHVADYLNGLIEKQWCVILITGRSFTYATKILEHFKYPLYCGVQNGSALYEYPSKKQLFKSYLPASLLKELELNTPFMIELGYEQGDECFYNAKRFPPQELAYVHFRQQISLCKWTAVEKFSTLPIAHFAQGKTFANREAMEMITQHFASRFSDEYKVTVLTDDCREDSYVIHLNHKEANKGCAISKFRQCIGSHLPVIAAGNDNNDFEMVRDAQVGIAMPDSPSSLLEVATIRALGGPEEGIVEALEQAQRLL